MFSQRGPFDSALYRAADRYRQLRGKPIIPWSEHEELEIAQIAARETGLGYSDCTIDPKIADIVRALGNNRKIVDAKLKPMMDEAWAAYSPHTVTHGHRQE